MGLDYTSGCVNFRDVGEYINLIDPNHELSKNILLRGGSIDYVEGWNEIDNTRTVINLRNRKDPEKFDSCYLHFPMANKFEKYDTRQKEVKLWLNQILKTFEKSDIEFPVLIHCLSGKDRTGIVVIAILLILGIEQETIKKEYFLSDGELKEEWFDLAVSGILPIESYFDRVDLKIVRENFKPLFATH